MSIKKSLRSLRSPTAHCDPRHLTSRGRYVQGAMHPLEPKSIYNCHPLLPLNIYPSILPAQHRHSLL
jgi:hypothetical protein